MNSFGILQALVFEPKKAFVALDARPRVLFPLVLLIVSTIGMLIWYFSIVDSQWLVDRSLSASGAQMTEEQAQAARAMSPAIITWTSVIGGFLLLVLVRVLEAVYYLLAGKITNVQRSYKHWLALACWSSLPGVLAVIPAAIVMLTATSTQIDQGDLQVLSLNNLIFHRDVAEPGYSLLISINLLQLLGLYLATLGYRVWSGRSWLASAVFTCLPWVLICGTWAYFALGRS